MIIEKNTRQNNFANAPAFPIIDAALGRGDLRLFDESNLPPLTDEECLADERMTAPEWPISWFFQVDAGGKAPNKRRARKLAPVFNRSEYVIICESKPDFLTTVYAVSSMTEYGNAVLIGNVGGTLLDWYAICSKDRDIENGLIHASIVTTKRMTALQEAMTEKCADGLVMLNPEFARVPEKHHVWNYETGRYEVDRAKLKAVLGHD